MTSASFERLLGTVCERLASYAQLEREQILWAVSGSVALSLLGIEVDCRDLDVVTTGESAALVADLLGGTEIEPIGFRSSAGLRGRVGRVRLEAIEIEILGDLENELPDGRWGKPPRLDCDVELIWVAGHNCPVMSLAALRRAYRAMGRAEKVKLIDESL
jgi:aminoglycoside-2''-adenylyltransferase